MSSYIAKDVRCPFYKKEDGVRICCEGIEESFSVHVVFASSQGRLAYQKKKCCRDYNACPIAAINFKKWEGK